MELHKNVCTQVKRERAKYTSYEKSTGRYSLAVGGGLQFRSTRKSCLYTIAKMQGFYRKSRAYTATSKERYYSENYCDGSIEVALGLRFK